STCSTGPVQCCNSVQHAGAPAAAGLLGLLGVVVQDLNVPIGLTCSPISVIGGGSGGNCNAQTVCCENNNFSGLIAIGCTPINLQL
ncbi:fungal hydrophobin, partial [Panus rudis PR-1116 ss-1]